ncbi:MAG TPA: hypothetical protein DCY40_01685 [Actinobacteria bacterium]|nr:hypothetical protein [Actinomycetota bacterium]
MPLTNSVDVDGPPQCVVADPARLEDVVWMTGGHHRDAIRGDVGEIRHQLEQDGGDLASQDVETSRVGHFDSRIGGDGASKREILDAVEGSPCGCEGIELPSRVAPDQANVQGPNHGELRLGAEAHRLASHHHDRDPLVGQPAQLRVDDETARPTSRVSEGFASLRQ